MTKSFISSCSSASVHSLPCGPRIAEEKESGFPAPSRFKSAGAGEYTRGRWWGSRQRRREIEGGGCGGVVVQAEGVMEHKRAGVEESSSASSSSESSDSNASKGLGWKKREVGLGGAIVGRSGKVVWGRGGGGDESVEWVDKNGGK